MTVIPIMTCIDTLGTKRQVVRAVPKSFAYHEKIDQAVITLPPSAESMTY
jgi:hypothetical protein